MVAIGEESAGQICERTATALARELGVEPVRFPGDHTGFVDKPAACATLIRDILRG